VLHQIERGRSKQQELTRALACRPALVDNTPQFGKELRDTMDFIDDCQAPDLRL
jgi:hypothetical protein